MGTVEFVFFLLCVFVVVQLPLTYLLHSMSKHRDCNSKLVCWLSLIPYFGVFLFVGAALYLNSLPDKRTQEKLDKILQALADKENPKLLTQ